MTSLNVRTCAFIFIPKISIINYTMHFTAVASLDSVSSSVLEDITGTRRGRRGGAIEQAN
jgi:hypothetical protein